MTSCTRSTGSQGRKARYLISIYDNLVTKMIPWEKVSHLGWTKLKDLAPVLTPENVDEWVAKAEKLHGRGTAGPDQGPEARRRRGEDPEDHGRSRSR